MNTKIRNKVAGFTIIEVLIVLAIAGLVMLVVFLAVPALQRNSRNSQRGSDVAAALGGVSEYVSNNNGTLPKAIDMTQGQPQWKKDSTVANGIGSGLEFKTSYYKAGGSTDIIADTDNTTATNLPTIDTAKLYINNYLRCDKNSLGPVTAGATVSTTVGTDNLVTTAGATSRNIVAVYATESSSGKVVLQCTES